MNYWLYSISALAFAMICTPIDNRLARKNVKRWKRYLIAFAIGFPLILGLNVIVGYVADNL